MPYAVHVVHIDENAISGIIPIAQFIPQIGQQTTARNCRYVLSYVMNASEIDNS
jgi:hypothetical protein